MSNEKFKKQLMFTTGMRTVIYNTEGEADSCYIHRKDVIKMVENIHDEINARIDKLVSETKYTQSKDLVVSKILAFKEELV